MSGPAVPGAVEPAGAPEVGDGGGGVAGRLQRPRLEGGTEVQGDKQGELPGDTLGLML